MFSLGSHMSERAINASTTSDISKWFYNLTYLWPAKLEEFSNIQARENVCEAASESQLVLVLTLTGWQSDVSLNVNPVASHSRIKLLCNEWGKSLIELHWHYFTIYYMAEKITSVIVIGGEQVSLSLILNLHCSANYSAPVFRFLISEQSYNFERTFKFHS